MGPQSPPPDPAASLRSFPPGADADGLWFEPVYRRHGYEEALPEVWLRAELAPRLIRAANWLRERDAALLVLDGWRPIALQRRLWKEYRGRLARTTGLTGEALDARAREFVTPPEERGRVPAHLTGGAVDVTLCSPRGEALELGGEFDELTDRSRPTYYEREDLSPEEALYRDRRRLLERAMGEGGFRRLPSEWWHFEYGTPNWARWTGQPAIFDPLTAAAEEE